MIGDGLGLNVTVSLTSLYYPDLGDGAVCNLIILIRVGNCVAVAAYTSHVHIHIHCVT